MNNFITVLKKELLDIFRDKKALLFTVLLPLILYPVMFKFISSTVNDMEKDVQKEINIVIEGDENSRIANFLKEQTNIRIPEVSDSRKALKKGEVQAIVVIPEDFDARVSTDKDLKVEVLYDEESNKSMIAIEFITSVYEQYKNSLVEATLKENGLDSSLLQPFQIETKSGINAKPDDEHGIGSVLISMLPSLLVIFMVSSTVAMAGDLGAGEKERCTFEPLLSTPARRTSILWGKIASLCTVSFITLIANMIAMIFSLNTFMGDGGSLDIKVSGGTILGIMIVSILLLITLSALQMAVSLFARSTKEAGTYLSGIMVPAMLLSYLPMMMDAKSIKIPFFNIPIANAVCLMKEFMVGIFNVTHIAIVLGWHLLYVVAAILFAKYMFSKEEVIFRT